MAKKSKLQVSMEKRIAELEKKADQLQKLGEADLDRALNARNEAAQLAALIQEAQAPAEEEPGP